MLIIVQSVLKWFSVSATLLLLLCCGGETSLKEVLRDARQNTAPTEFEVMNAAKQAIGQAIDSSTRQLSRDGGFSRSIYRIKLPQTLDRLAQQARSVGLDRQINELEQNLNLAAEAAAPAAREPFESALRALEITDIQALLKNKDTAITEYFKANTESAVYQRLRPMVAQVNQRSAVTRSYQELLDRLTPFAKVLNYEIPQSLDLDHYVTEQTMTAIYSKIAREERLIRQNPTKRSTELMQKVFSYYR